ncbi:OVARIAN TUMOR DOMAIN-containing deubiquitinating enzyme 12-like isoform X2 [Syzygium oleosum]|uniref:OVARIAN TUMOR DOMAIN-containing deubiquitinating enzyme 12-like isoform X2 n=1 Tax=Syzygium oleosum TaxID=219896 RepID=UPI0011D2B113|nr:OVARIAN TUMOR DOMAIN-containing deubiquitinating enzyme 12-like isoform X2 [Syzygium oleosum]
MVEPESDACQWGRHIFDINPLVGYYTITSHHDANSTYHGQYPMSHCGGECSSVENDEIIARTLQEEFSQLAVREVPVYSHAEEEDSKVSIDQQNWQTPSPRMYWSGNIYNHGEADHGWVYDSSISHGDGEDYSYSQQPVDGYEYSEMDNPLNQMVPIPHVPRINGEIPSTDEATSDYERLRERLQLYGLVERKVEGDGNCQFRALSDQLFKTSENHEYVRQQIVEQLRTLRELYEGYVPMDYDEYLCKMSNNGEWGDHVTLQAAADAFAVKIFVITSFKDTCSIEILPNGQKPNQVLSLSFWAEVHYNSIYPQDIPASHCGKKKKWWSSLWA